MSASPLMTVLRLFVSLLCIAVVYQVAYPNDARISDIQIDGLAPFTVSFDFRNPKSTVLEDVAGKAFLTDQTGLRIIGFVIHSFDVDPNETTRTTAFSQWEFQQTGTYILQLAIDIGEPNLVTGSLSFRIAPITVPYAQTDNQQPQNGSLSTITQQPLYTITQQPMNWGIPTIDAPLSWEETTGPQSIVVALIDSGVDFSVEELKGTAWVNEDEVPDNNHDDDHNGYVDDIHGWDFRDNDAGPTVGTRIHWHGTFIASIISAWPKERAIVGVAPGVRIMDLRFLDTNNLFYGRDWDAFASAVNYAIDNDADIINLSVASRTKPPQIFERAIERAANSGVILVGIAGNESNQAISYPAAYPSVLAVSATNQSSRLANFSNYGEGVTLAAPGANIAGLFPGGVAGTSSGTSFAAPHVTGTLALMLSIEPDTTTDFLISTLRASCSDLGDPGNDTQFGSGLVNTYQAVIQTRH